MTGISWINSLITFSSLRENGMIKDHYGSYTSLPPGKGMLEKKEKKDLVKVSVKQHDPRESKAAGKAKTKLSYKEQQEYGRLEADIEELEKEKTSLEAELECREAWL